MRIFYAGCPTLEKYNERLQKLFTNRLLSYYYRCNSFDKYFLCDGGPGYIKHLMMDSGAFSAWSNDKHIELEDYIGYCLQYMDNITHIVNLDVIPARPGQKKISDEEIERSASIGWRNAERMLRAGIPVDKLIHVFHQGEDLKWLKRMVDKFQYIGLSPANDRTIPEKMRWLDSCMPYVTDSKGAPLIKFHGFAVTSLRLMARYPWYSVDSATCIQTSGRGTIFIPFKRQGTWDYASKCYQISVGTKKPFHEYSPVLQKVFMAYLLEHDIPLGKFSESGEVLEEGITTKQSWRAVCTSIYLTEYGRTLAPWPERVFNKDHLDGRFEL